MASDGEMGYFDAIGEAGRSHALSKPFSDNDRGGLFLEVGALLSLLPPPPADVLDCGCGTGWLTWLLQRCGYRTTGVDVAPTAIELATSNAQYLLSEPPRFLVAEVESMSFDAEFDAVVFFDSLHHSVDEEAALRNALRALRPGGVCVTSEPGKGHAVASAAKVHELGITERDMPARHIAAVAKRVGFARAEIFARADSLGTRLYGGRGPSVESSWKRALRRSSLVRAALTLRTTEYAKRDNGLVLLSAPGPMT